MHLKVPAPVSHCRGLGVPCVPWHARSRAQNALSSRVGHDFNLCISTNPKDYICRKFIWHLHHLKISQMSSPMCSESERMLAFWLPFSALFDRLRTVGNLFISITKSKLRNWGFKFKSKWGIIIWGSVKIPCWPACLESLGHRSGWGPHRFTWFGYMVLISVLICKGIPLSWSRSDLVSAWHLGGLRCPWPPSSNASPQRWSSTAQKKKLTAHTPANPPAPFFWKGRATVVCFSFYISSFHIYFPEST